jgi:hypothetical protein
MEIRHETPNRALQGTRNSGAALAAARPGAQTLDGPLPLTKTHVFLGVFEFGDDLDAVTAIMGVDPTEAWLRGDSAQPPPAARRTHSRWSLHSGLPTSASFEDQLGALLDRLEAVGDQVREVASRFTAVVWVAIYTPEPNPVLSLSAAAARRLGALGLGIYFDIYSLPEEGECPENLPSN